MAALAGAPASLHSSGDGAVFTRGFTGEASRQILQNWGIWVRSCTIPVVTICAMRKYINESSAHKNTPFILKSLDLLSLLAPKRVLVITASSALDLRMSAVRDWYPRLLVGNVKRHQWMIRGLDIVLATPEEACEFALSARMSSYTFAAVVIDNISFAPGVVEDVLSTFSDVTGVPFVQRKVLRPRIVDGLFMPPAHMDDKFLAILREHLPEAAACPGLGDKTFCIMLAASSIVFEDWSGVLACVPSLFRNKSTTSSSALLLAPEHRVLQLTKFVDEFLGYMGCKSSDVLVGTPSFFLSKDVGDVRRVLIVEAGKLPAHEVKAVLYQNRDATIAVHSPPPEGLEDIFLDWKCKQIKPARVTLEAVCQLHQEVISEEEKVEHAYRIWKQLWRGYKRLVVFSDEPHKVGEALSLRNVKVRVTDQEMDQEMVKELERDYLHHVGLLVTNRYFRDTPVVINLDLPHAASGYLERCGNDRTDGPKLVVNIVTRKELSTLEGFVEKLNSRTTAVSDNCGKQFREYVMSLD